MVVGFCAGPISDHTRTKAALSRVIISKYHGVGKGSWCPDSPRRRFHFDYAVIIQSIHTEYFHPIYVILVLQMCPTVASMISRKSCVFCKWKTSLSNSFPLDTTIIKVILQSNNRVQYSSQRLRKNALVIVY